MRPTSLAFKALAFGLLAAACSSSSTPDPLPSAQSTGAGGATAAEPATGLRAGACYKDTRTGCQDFSWSQIQQAIDFVYAIEPSYEGYDKARATALAKELYENGVPKEAGLSAFTVHATNGRADRVVLSVRDESGKPLAGLSAASFVVQDASGAAQPATRAKRVGDATSEDLRLRLSTIVDDSGSIQDCDAQFVADGLGALFDLVPPVHQTELIKFATNVGTAQAFTADGKALAHAARSMCTDRGSTALWDAVDRGLGDLGASKQTGELSAAIVFSDGGDNNSSASLAQVIASAKDKRVPVIVLGVGLADPFVLTKLARETGGAFVYVPSATKVVDAFQIVGSFLTEAYVVDLPAGGADPRRVSVKLPSGAELAVTVPR